MVTDAKEETTNRPYPPPSNLTSVLHRLRSRNLPEQIDTEYLRDTSIPEGTIGRTLFAMRFLGLIGGAGEPKESLKSIHTSTDEEYQEILSGLIREAYKEVFNVIDPSQDSQSKILNVFRRYTPASQRVRMVIFFLGMCREAGIPTLDVPKARAMSTIRPSERITKRLPKKDETVVSKRDIKVAGVDPALEGLINTLPSPGTPLSLERRQQWLDMAEATLRFVYPEEEIGSGEEQRPESTEQESE